MSEKIEFPLLKAENIECRVGMVKTTATANGCTLLLYKDARVDMQVLDSVVGAENWQREHYEVKGNMYCRVGIYAGVFNENRTDWIWKADCGTESYTEKEKGEASDSFKRACFNWGVGRELYTSPFIWIKLEKEEAENGRLSPKLKFFVKEIAYNTDRSINYVVIVDNNDKVRFTNKRTTTPPPVPEKILAPKDITMSRSGQVVSPESLLDIKRELDLVNSRKAFETAYKKYANEIVKDKVLKKAFEDLSKIYPKPQK